MRRLLIVLAVLLFGIMPLSAQSGDGIPDNCEHGASANVRAIFPRYEPQNRRLVLVNWNTGADVRTLGTDIDSTIPLGWSVDCRYLAAAVGPTAHMDTIVWDTVNGAQIGAVPDAYQRPHKVTWGPHNYLVVETRNGAVLWNVPANTQTTLTDAYNQTTGRNFSRLRWDAEHWQLIANLAVGGRTVYDLTTGLEAPLAARQTNSRPAPAEAPTVRLGGREYPCEGDFRHGYRYWFSGSGVRDVYLGYDFTNHTVFLELNDIYGPEEPLVMLEADIDSTWVQTRTWSSSCRYIVASLGIPEEDASNTVVWDVIEARQLGMIRHARKIMHPVSDSGYDDVLLVQTRDGAILWRLDSNMQFELTDQVEIPVSGRSDVRNFAHHTWGPSYFYAVPLDNRRSIDVYAIDTGDRIARYVVDFEIDSLGYTEDQLLDVRKYSGEWEAVLLDPDSGAIVQRQQIASADRYPNDLKAVIGSAGAIVGESGYGTFSSGVRYYNPWSLEFYYRFGNYSGCGDQIVSYDRASRSVQISDDGGSVRSVIDGGVNFTYSFGWSPDCRYISAQQAWTSNADVPYDDQQLDDIYRDDLSYDVVIWNVATGTRIITLPRPYRFESPAAVAWSPQTDRALVRTTNGYFIVNPATGEQTLLTYAQPRGYGDAINTYFDTYWDFERGQLIVSSWGGALVFDLRTGVERAFLNGGCCGIRVSENLEYVTTGRGVYNLNR